MRPCWWHRELYPVDCDAKLMWGKKKYVCMTGSLCCTAEIDRML